MRLLRSTCYRIQDHNQHLETDAILQESGSDRVFCIPCASIFICDRFESITAKLTVISELQYLAHAAVADPTVEKAALLSAIAQLIISCGSQSMLAPESLDVLFFNRLYFFKYSTGAYPCSKKYSLFFLALS